MFILAQQMGKAMISLVGGPAHAKILVGPLELLANFEETVVREKAVEDLVEVVQCSSENDLLDAIVPMVKRLAEAEWFTPRCSAAALIAPVYRKLKSASARTQLLDSFKTMLSDETPMVRRALARTLGSLAEALDGPQVAQTIIPTLKSLADDSQATVRIVAVGQLAPVCKVLDEGQNASSMIPLIHEIATERSWRLRMLIASQMAALCDGVGKKKASSDLLPLFAKFLADSEIDVREASMKQLAEVFAKVNQDAFIKEVLPRGEANGNGELLSHPSFALLCKHCALFRSPPATCTHTHTHSPTNLSPKALLRCGAPQ